MGVKGNQPPHRAVPPDGMQGSGEGYAAAGGRARGLERGGGEAGVPVQVDACVLLCGLNDFKKVWLLVFSPCVCLGVCACVRALVPACVHYLSRNLECTQGLPKITLVTQRLSSEQLPMRHHSFHDQYRINTHFNAHTHTHTHTDTHRHTHTHAHTSCGRGRQQESSHSSSPH
jgi:hypothetical protein